MARHVVATVADIPPGARKRVDVEGRPVAIFNVKGEFFALLDRCPHQGASLSKGKLVGLVESTAPGHYRYSRHSEIIRCPWHGWEYDLRTGKSWCEPHRARVRNFTVAIEPGRTLVEGPYVAETFSIRVEDDHVVIDTQPPRLGRASDDRARKLPDEQEPKHPSRCDFREGCSGVGLEPGGG